MEIYGLGITLMMKTVQARFCARHSFENFIREISEKINFFSNI